LAVLLVAAACSGPYTRQQAVPSQYRLTVPEGIRVAAQAMQTVGYFPVKQDAGAGYIIGEQKRKDSFGLDMFTLSLSVSFLPAGEGRLNMSATAAVSENIVLTDELDDEVDKFYGAFQRTLEQRAAGRAPTPALAPGLAPEAVPPAVPLPRPTPPVLQAPPPAPAPSVPSPPARAPGGTGYQL
jgi:hypothetical protein